MSRIHNFSAGPAALPLPVLQSMQRDLVDYQGHGASILEMSHRDSVIVDVFERAEADLRQLLGLTDDFAVLFLAGGARGQFAMLPRNLLPDGGRATFLDTGTWASGAIDEARKVVDVDVLWSGKDGGYRRVPRPDEYVVPADAGYLHYTSNNTIYGTQCKQAPVAPDGVPLVLDASSDILSEPLDVSRHGVIYAGAQKNVGPAGVTLVFVRRSLLARSRPTLPDVWNYALQTEKESMLNTPPVFAVYAVGLVARHLLDNGGIPEMDAANDRKAERLYRCIDESGGFYVGHAEPGSRSRMNVTFRIADGGLEKAFLAGAEAAAMSGLRGHRSVGGLRASIYNAVPEASVDVLVSFMEEFARTRG